MSLTANAPALTPELPAFRRWPVWLGVAALIPITFWIDSSSLAERYPHAQWFANALLVLAFLVIERGAPPRLRAVMWWGLVMGTGGEIVFSLFIGMYEYRLENVPIYVPIGHSLLYAGVYYFVHEPYVRKRAASFTKVMIALGVSYAVYWLVVDRDVYGFLCTGVFFYLLHKHRTSSLFFAAMFLAVAYLEQLGTGFGCWYWHRALLDKFSWLPSGNPPAGIAVFYFGFDGGCLDLYARSRKGLAARYERLKARADARAKAGAPSLVAAE